MVVRPFHWFLPPAGLTILKVLHTDAMAFYMHIAKFESSPSSQTTASNPTPPTKSPSHSLPQHSQLLSDQQLQIPHLIPQERVQKKSS